MTKIIGAFVFEDAGNGCLTGKWLNNDELTPYPEASKLRKVNEGRHPFEGTYKTTWIQLTEEVEHTDLLIEFISQDVCKVQWLKNGKLIYDGRGMLFKGMLIGSYWM